MEETVELGREGLKMFGLRLPARPGDLSILKVFLSAKIKIGRKTVDQLVKAAGISQANMSQHLKQLKSVRLVSSKRRGLNVIYLVIHQY